MNLEDSITDISGIGPRYAYLLEKLDIKTVEDLLLHIPFRYEDYSNIKTISELIASEPTTVTVELVRIDNIFTRNGKRLTKAVVEDNTGKLDVIWFNQHFIKRSLPINSIVSLHGALDPKSTKPTFINPEWEKIYNGQPPIHTGRITPIYNLTEGLTSKWLRRKIKQILDLINISENLPVDILQKHNLQDKVRSIQQIHFPNSNKEIIKAKRRLAFEEILFLHLNGIYTRKQWEKKENSHRIYLTKDKLEEFKRSLPFVLTNDQESVIQEILQDLQENSPMNRLLQGDVGSGKTVVATVALLACAQSGFNSIYMAPTQILANQHYKSIKKLLKLFNIDIQLITGNNKTTLSNTKSKPNNKRTITIGTHAILYRLKTFSNIGLVIIDEQHKFGVEQRSTIVEEYSKNLTPNLLTMTATPIPRSLALTFYGDLDLSIIKEMPKGRKKVKTWVISEQRRLKSYEWIKKQIIENDTQVFWVCPFIEESLHENLQNVKAAQVEFENLKTYFPKQKFALLHGRIDSNEKDKIIDTFLKREIDILVTTPVIEVGIDIPHANIIFIETAERFGLASLHQLRGRVGRRNNQGYCILIPSTKNSSSTRRLKNMEKIHQGNKLAEIDFMLRGPGNIYGTEQHGGTPLKIADFTNTKLIQETKKAATSIINNLNKYKAIKKHLENISKIKDN